MTYAKTGQGLFKSSLILYFLLLASFIPLYFNRNHIALEIIVAAIDGVIIGAFSIRYYSALKPVISLPRWYWWILPAPIVIVLCMVGHAYLWAILNLIHVPYVGSGIDAHIEFGLGWAGAIALICLQPGIFEELAFRGLIAEGLSSHLTQGETRVLSAFMFALLHLSLWNFPMLFFIGWLLIWLREKTGSLLPGMAMHAFYNLICIIMEIHFPFQ